MVQRRRLAFSRRWLARCRAKVLAKAAKRMLLRIRLRREARRLGLSRLQTRDALLAELHVLVREIALRPRPTGGRWFAPQALRGRWMQAAFLRVALEALRWA